MPVQITFRGFEPSEFIEQHVRKQAAKLERFRDRILGCHVTLELPHQRHQHGNIFRVRVDVSVPGNDIVVGREPAMNHTHEDVYVAIRDAFQVVGRKLEATLARDVRTGTRG